MVVSKDSKRKRKESPPPQPPMTESSPEMPKRTKVQAQRKFAQGQSAPTSYTAAIAASSSSTTGPSASSESREPPTEILPNKRPKTEDFLTFLCFRGTSALPAHLDFLNQGKVAETEKTPNKKVPKPTKSPKKQIAKKGRKVKPKTNAKEKINTSTKCENEPIASTSAAAAALLDDIKPTSSNEPLADGINDTKENFKKEGVPVLSSEETVMPFAVRKRAEQVVEGNRRNREPTERLQRNINTETDTSGKPQETKRRSNRTTTKEMKSMIEPDTDEDETYKSENEEVGQKLSVKDDRVCKNSKTPTRLESKSQTPTKESTSPTVEKNRKGKVDKKLTDEVKVDSLKKDETQESPIITQKEEINKVKSTVKRPRQKESPIFIPSPEPTGRMTRQRAFFEPVKVPPRDEELNNLGKSKKEEILPNEVIENKEKVKLDEVLSTDANYKGKETKINKEDQKDNLKKIEDLRSKNKSVEPTLEDIKNSSTKNVFDFSSDDEQPLAKTIKLKKKTGSPKKVTQNVKRQVKKIVQKKALENSAEKQLKDKEEKSNKIEKLAVRESIAFSTPNEAESLSQPEKTGDKKKRINLKKKKIAYEENQSIKESKIEAQEIKVVQSPTKKAINIRQQRKKVKPDVSTPNGSAPNEESESSPPLQARNQRPSRKTKEAAAIYMGIIGHKLQQKEDEDDDLSLNSFPELPNVKEMEKMEIELKKNAAQTTAASIKTSATSPTFAKSPSKSTAADSEKQVSTVRRGRPPKQNKPPPPAKREIEGMLVKKGALSKVVANVQTDSPQIEKEVDQEKVESEDEDFLLNEEVKETKRKLEKSFSDSDDEPLAIKVSLKTSEKDLEQNLKKLDFGQQIKTTSAPTTTTVDTSVTTVTSVTILPIGSKLVPTPPPTHYNAITLNTSPITAAQQNASQSPSLFKIVEKKSPIPNSKILNVPAAYTIPSTQNSNVAPNIHANYNKIEHKLLSGNMSSSYLPPVSPHYHPSHTRASHHPTIPAAKSPTQPPPPTLQTHIAAPPPPQSPLKYQTPPTTYPPPIEAYPSPKINPNFLTPKFDRSALPRPNNFPSPSPVKFELSSTTTKTGIANSTLSPKTLPALQMGSTTLLSATPSTSAAAVGTAANASSDPLKDEIGSILAANLMPSKEESGKIFGIASVSLAQSSGPDNTKCTLGKCGSIHKPALGPVVPTEGYIGDQLSSKERRKAKVNMTHEQIQKWLIECSSNPDEIHDDLDDDFDDNLRPNLFATTPPPTRDDKESTSFSSSSKATRDLGKSESAWSGKGPSLKAIPVVATANPKEEDKKEKQSDLIVHQLQTTSENETHSVNLMIKSSAKQNSNTDTKNTKEKLEKQLDKKSKDEKTSKEANKEKETKQSKTEKEKEKEKEKEHTIVLSNLKSTAAGKQSTALSQNLNSIEAPSSSKGNRKKGAAVPTAKEEKLTAQKPTVSNTIPALPSGKIQKRTPVYNQKILKQVELKETTTTSHKKKSPFSYTFGAFSADNEKSIYSFDKDDEDVGAKPLSKPVFRRQSRRDSHPDDINSTPTPNLRTSPTKQKRSAAAAAEKANKDIANASQSSSVSLTLSPSENCKLVKVSLEAEQQTPVSKAKTGKLKNKLDVQKATVDTAAADSDSDGHTFYIPLQGTGMGGSAEGGIQGVAVKLGREGPEGPNQKVIMHATLVTKAQMGQNSKPLPDSVNASEIVKNLLISSGNQTSGSTVAETSKKPASPQPIASTSAAVATTANSASNSLKNVPIGTVQPRFKGTTDPTASVAQPSTSIGGSGCGLVRVNSNSSLFSGSAKSKHGTAGPPAANANKKFKDDTPIKMSNNTAFPRHDDPTQMVEAPIFRPTEKEFSDPIDFIERITPIAARFGICKIIPPASFKPECRISDEMRFTAYNQYVHKMLHRWGPSAKELSAIKKYLATQSIIMNHPPWIGGMEVDLPRLYHTVQEQGGLKEVIEKKKWARVAEEMCIPKLAQDRVTKLDDIYCKYLLPYDTLSPTERQKLFDEVEADWAKREARARRNADRFVNTESVSNEENDLSTDDDEESEEEVDGVSMECIVKGRSMPLSQFYRIARNTMTLWYKNTEPIVNEVEADFWRHVAVRDSHVCVHSGSIDSSGWGYGFPSPGPKGKGSNYARHPWNLKVLTNNPSSVLRSLGPVMGVTVPTLHVGMLFSACCWYRDPHGLSWIEYLHTGASKLWYGIPDDQSANFRSALTSLIPTHCQNKTIWLPCDTVMVPPHMLTDRSVSLCRIEQKPGEFIVVFPRAYTSSLATGYVVSESVYFATNSWLDLAKDDFRDIHDSCEPAMFSLEQLLFALGADQRVSPETLQQMLPMLNEVYEKETAAREQLKAAGVTSTEKVPSEKSSKSKKQHPVKSIESECDLCRANLYISMVKTDEGNVYCLQHALKNLNNGNIQAKQCKLIFAFYIEDIENLIKDLSDKVQKRCTVSNKKNK